ncbi:MAG: hypothetical protein WCV84_06065 [Patescibacteria group bacterium]
MSNLISFLRKKTTIAVIFIAAVLAILIAPAIADQTSWQWKDQSNLLPTRDGMSLTIVTERHGQWLLSDGSNLYRFDGTNLTNLTKKAQSLGITSIGNIFSDGSNWLVYSHPAGNLDPQIWLTDGASTWTNVSARFTNARGGFNATGKNGTWYTKSSLQGTDYTVGTWTLGFWNDITSQPKTIELPSTVSPSKAGVFTFPNKTKLVSGVSAPVVINGNWYFIGGQNESQTEDGRAVQNGKGGIWRMNQTTLTAMTGLPTFRFVSGIWPGTDSVLIATSDTASNPFVVDRLWVFNGSIMQDVTAQAASVGLTSADTRGIHATWDGTAWMILNGKKLVRFDNASMVSQGNTRDYFYALSSNGKGVIVLGGLVSTSDNSFPSEPRMAKLCTAEQRGDVVIPVVSDIISATNGPTITTFSNPTKATIGNGKSFTFRVETNDAAGIASTRIYVNGALLKTCTSATCEYAETFWTNGLASRQISFFARATSKRGYTSESAPVVLTIDQSSVATNETVLGSHDMNGNEIALPLNTPWTRDTRTSTTWIAWRTPTNGTLSPSNRISYSVAAQNSRGLGNIDIWVNGTIQKTCNMNGDTQIRVCRFELNGNDYPAGTDVAVNANIGLSQSTATTWTTLARVTRNNAVPSAPAVITKTETLPAHPVFATTLTIDPNVTEIKRGESFTIHTMSQSNVNALRRVEIQQNGVVVHACGFGARLTPAACDWHVDTSEYRAGTTLRYTARVTDGEGHDIWSNTRQIYVRDQKTETNVVPTKNGKINVWAWTEPLLSELVDGQTATYSVGAWATNNVQRIDMIVDGVVKNSCYSGNTAGTRECNVVINSKDYGHRHIVTVNARITDYAGNVVWSDVYTTMIRREWELEPARYTPAYVTVTSNPKNGFTVGDRVTLLAHGWSPRGIATVEIYTNGKLAARCGSDTCSFTTQPVNDHQLEYQARLIDVTGDSVWTGVVGVNAK